MECSATPYDEVPYPDAAGAMNDARRVQTVAAWLGWPTPALANARVLELGCGTATNLLCQAVAFPEASFVGIDYAHRAIEQGRRDMNALALKNVALHCSDLAKGLPCDGPFDYILCHGVFSWVEPRLQRKILEIMTGQLRDDGFAYLSFNTYPGWHLRQSVREMLLFHTSGMPAQQALVQAREMLAQAAQISSPDTPYGRLLRQEYCQLCTAGDGYLYHEMLETHNQPFRFSEFAGLLEEHGLDYVGDANFSRLHRADVPAEANLWLETLPGVMAEQYLDYWRGTSFRGSVIRRKTSHNTRQPRLLTAFHFGITPAASLPRQEELHPAVQAAADYLESQQPEFVSWTTLFEVADRLAKDNSVREQLDQFLNQAVARGIIVPVLTPPTISRQAGPFPRAHPHARVNAQRSQPVMSQRMQSFELTAFEYKLLGSMEGTRSLATIREQAHYWIEEDHRLLSPLERRATPEESVEEALHRLGHMGLLLE